MEPSSHATAVTELLSTNPKYTRNFVGTSLYNTTLTLTFTDSVCLTEYIVDRVIEAVRLGLDVPENARGRTPSRHQGPEKLAQFMHRVLYMSDTRVPVLLVALVYIERSMAYLRISQEQWAHERVFLGALICAHKVSLL